MSALDLEELQMPAEEPSGRDRIDLRAEPEWIARVRHQARRLGFGSISAYIRHATTKQLAVDEREEAEEKGCRPRGKKKAD
jgi:hypothetical protein